MANSSVPITAGSGTNIDTRTDPDGNHRQVLVIGDADTATTATVDANGVDVDVVRLPSLPVGTNNIGDVDVLTLPALPAGTNNIGDVDVLTVIPGTSATSLGKAEDAPHANGDTGVAVWTVRKDTAASTAATDGDYAAFTTDSSGRMHTNVGAVPADPFGLNADAASAAGGAGSIQAKLRLMTTQLAAIQAAVETIDNAIAGSEMQVDIVSGSTAGTEYTEGATDATITGSAILWEDTADTLRPVSAAKPMPVNVVAGGTSGTQYTEGDVDTTITGTAMLHEIAGNVLATVSDTNPMPIAGTISLTGEDHIGEVGGNTAVIRPTVTVDTAIYAALDVLGAAAASGVVTLTNAMRISGGTGVLQSVVLYDDDNEKAAITLLFFNAAPSGGTYTGNGALALSAGDKATYLGRVDIATTDYFTVGGDAVASVRNIALPVQAVGTANLYMIPIVTSGTPTYAASTDLKFALGFLRD